MYSGRSPSRRFAVNLDMFLRGKKKVIVFQLTLFCVVLPWICYVGCLYHSAYHQLYHLAFVADSVSADVNALRVISEENDKRVIEADDYLLSRKLDNYGATINHRSPLQEVHDSTKERKDMEQIKIAITIVSTPRSKYKVGQTVFEPKYLTQNVARFLKLISLQDGAENSGFRYSLFVCDVGLNRGIEAAYIANSAAESNLLSFIHFDGSGQDVKFKHQFYSNFYKEKMDYSFCINQTLMRQTADYLLMVEDDALPKDETLDLVNHLIHNYLERNDLSKTNKTKHKVGYFKLYHPKRLLGYVSLEVERVPELLAASVVIGSALYFIYFQLTANVIPNFKARIKSGTLKDPSREKDIHLTPSAKTWILICFNCMMLMLMIGRPHLQNWRKLSMHFYSISPDPFCCTQGVLFPRSSAIAFSEHISNEPIHSKNRKDDTLFDFQKNVRPGYLIQPGVFEHVGVFSSLRDKVVDPHLFIDS